ncbi:BZ3500_MvSof-1268-A1-R1_Chr5-3g08293 [Microbotryum saponariae]|uniref:BZ3500_MvSof-1268-A1-R1_Chr5-3g08293 protein n=1 Tax=Microbotryum saponariae TaxID=289078 RepID=A0A2X0KEZ4_9BASI|nr:BZ3500_MvSof-1268-A1-R1_Chr5-3g08293 [Microbotryum saponariae]SDA08401.1 BZ3501_MvSof-1269-A2-R1_Chr5-3g08021 [Microbotryum saponariae]
MSNLNSSTNRPTSSSRTGAPSSGGGHARDDVLQFLESLDDYSNPKPTTSTTSTTSSGSVRASAPSVLASSANSRTATARTLSNSTNTRGATGAAAGAPPPQGSLRASQNNSSLSISTGTPGNAATAPSSANPASSSTATPATANSNATEAQSVLDFLDEITQRSSTPTHPVQARPLPAPRTTGGGPAPSSLSRSTSRTSIQSTASSAPPPRRSTDSVRSTRIPASNSSNALSTSPPTHQQNLSSFTTTHATAPSSNDGAAANNNAGGWGWSSMWSQASNVVQQASHVVAHARTVAEEQVLSATQQAKEGGLSSLPGGLIKALGENEQAKKVMGLASNVHFDQLGKDLKSSTLKSLTDLINAVAPPIAEHELLKVSLSHDMIGYDGVEQLVYSSLSKVMEQVEGGTLIVNKGDQGTQRHSESNDEERDLNLVEGLEAAWKLAEANLDQLIKTTFKPSSAPNANNSNAAEGGITIPVTTCPIYMRIQPCLAPIPFLPPSLTTISPTEGSVTTSSAKALFFLLVLNDPTHGLKHVSLSQSLPANWLDIPFEENEWVEDVMVEVIRRSVEIIGQEYISHRMSARSLAIQKARDLAQAQLDQEHAQGGGGGEEPSIRVSFEGGDQQQQQQRQQEQTRQAAAMAGLTI